MSLSIIKKQTAITLLLALSGCSSSVTSSSSTVPSEPVVIDRSFKPVIGDNYDYYLVNSALSLAAYNVAQQYPSINTAQHYSYDLYSEDGWKIKLKVLEDVTDGIYAFQYNFSDEDEVVDLGNLPRQLQFEYKKALEIYTPEMQELHQLATEYRQIYHLVSDANPDVELESEVDFSSLNSSMNNYPFISFNANDNLSTQVSDLSESIKSDAKADFIDALKSDRLVFCSDNPDDLKLCTNKKTIELYGLKMGISSSCELTNSRDHLSYSSPFYSFNNNGKKTIFIKEQRYIKGNNLSLPKIDKVRFAFLEYGEGKCEDRLVLIETSFKTQSESVFQDVRNFVERKNYKETGTNIPYNKYRARSVDFRSQQTDISVNLSYEEKYMTLTYKHDSYN
ncbi:hypothetical protein F0231_17935 [Vibrio sp. RE86]|uniref:hypothetical protein n=1 Tax=Vibrio sp. RE86 TaxID=2607605 RepID=UPI00149380F7|nr:hypothetical protein [Vibrio sp. RE86]NOH81619.1 hypothetical protein [Vibrio sp. RE86]